MDGEPSDIGPFPGSVFRAAGFSLRDVTLPDRPRTTLDPDSENGDHSGLRYSCPSAFGFLVVIVAAFFLFRGVQAHAETALEREIRSALAAVPHPATKVGACVIDLSTGNDVFVMHADKPLIPASNMKVFAMAAALTALGPDFEFQTVLATDGRDLFLVGDGDPALGDEKLCARRGENITAVFERWAEKLMEDGVREVAGDIITDDSIFEDRRTHPTWEEADLDNWYAAPVGGLNFNDNCVDITVAPGGKPGGPVSVSVQPATPLIKIVNKCRTGPGGRPVLHHVYDSFEYKISGRCKKKWRFGPVSFPDPARLAGESLRAVLLDSGIEVAGGVRGGRVRGTGGGLPDALKIIGRHGTPIADVLGRAGKDSQNLFAECLLKRAGYAWSERLGASQPAGGWEQGREAVLETLRWARVDLKHLQVADGSGLSRANRCTPRQLAATLAWMHTQPGAKLFHESLSIAGVDGSLRKRLKDAQGRVRGKTGTMRGIRTLSGYVDSHGVPRYAFAVMFNGYKGSSAPYKEIQDRVCRAMLGRGRTTAGSH